MRSVHVFECIARVPSFLGGIVALILMGYAYLMWSLFYVQAQTTIERVQTTYSVAQSHVDALVNSTAALRGSIDAVG